MRSVRHLEVEHGQGITARRTLTHLLEELDRIRNVLEHVAAAHQRRLQLRCLLSCEIFAGDPHGFRLIGSGCHRIVAGIETEAAIAAVLRDHA
jgi:hypothetical protein